MDWNDDDIVNQVDVYLLGMWVVNQKDGLDGSPFETFNETAVVSAGSMVLLENVTRSSLINITYGSDLIIASVNYTWDPSVINLSDYNKDVSDFENVYTFSDNDAGYIRIDAYSYNNSLSGNLTIVGLDFVATDEAELGDNCSLLLVESALFNSSENETDHDVCNGTAVYGVEFMDVNQNISARGYPIRHAGDGDWGAAQNFTGHNITILQRAEIYMRKFGSPTFDLTVELRNGSVNGDLLDTIVFQPGDIPGSWSWINLDFDNVNISGDSDYFIVCQPPPSGVTDSFGYEWGYSYTYGNVYDGGAFWFTRDGGGNWSDLPNTYDFTFRTYGKERKLDQKQEENTGSVYYVHDYFYAAQNFTPTLGNLTSTDLYLYNNGDPPNDLSVSIRSSLNGSDLTTGYISKDQVPSNPSWINVDLTDISIIPGESYYIILSTVGGDIGDSYLIRGNNNNPYANGTSWVSTNYGSSWTEYSTIDICFRTYGY